MGGHRTPTTVTMRMPGRQQVKRKKKKITLVKKPLRMVGTKVMTTMIMVAM